MNYCTTSNYLSRRFHTSAIRVVNGCHQHGVTRTTLHTYMVSQYQAGSITAGGQVSLSWDVTCMNSIAVEDCDHASLLLAQIPGQTWISRIM
jgi:hypothetical protein